MFRRHWSGLPKDVSFSPDLTDLGYFINDQDEVRSIENPDYYFKFFLNRNSRINERQRFAFDHALEDIIHQRLENLGLVKTPLPLDTPPSKKHVPIFVDKSIGTKSRIVVVFGQVSKFLGLLAGRVASGHGGISEGSMVSVVEELGRQCSTADDTQAPGIILANVGQLYWWPEGQRALTLGSSMSLPLPSLVHRGWKSVPRVNEVEGQETAERHVEYIFEHVLTRLSRKSAIIDVVAIGDTADMIKQFLDDGTVWDTWGHRLSSLLLIDPICDVDTLKNPHLKDFLRKRARCYLRSPEPIDIPLAPPSGNPSQIIPALGAPCYSSSEPDHTECVLIKALRPALSYLERNALQPTAENELITVIPRPEEGQEGEPGDFGENKDDGGPTVEVFDPKRLEEQRRQEAMWSRFEETGEAADPDLPSDEDEKRHGEEINE